MENEYSDIDITTNDENDNIENINDDFFESNNNLPTQYFLRKNPYNTFAIILKIISSIVLFFGICFGFSALYSPSSDKISQLNIMSCIVIVSSSTVFFLLFFAIGEIIGILHDIRNNTQ